MFAMVPICLRARSQLYFSFLDITSLSFGGSIVVVASTVSEEIENPDMIARKRISFLIIRCDILSWNNKSDIESLRYIVRYIEMAIVDTNYMVDDRESDTHTHL